MKKNLPIIQQDSAVLLSKTENLVKLTSKVLNKTIVLGDENKRNILWEILEKSQQLPDMDASPVFKDNINAKLKKEILEDVTKLFFDGNFIECTDEMTNNIALLVYLKNLKSFTLNWGGLLNLPSKVIDSLNLVRLDLESNNLIRLPESICYLTNLTDLDLNDNNIVELPKEIGKLTNLTELHLGENNLDKLPINIVNLKYLEKLDLEFNPRLLLTDRQKEWITNLEKDGCVVVSDDDLLNRVSIKTHNNITYDQNEIIEFSDKYDVWVDEKTGLMWEVKTQLNIKYEYYLNQHIPQTQGLPRIHEKENIQDIYRYVRMLNKISFGGFNDWRVPMIKELKSLSEKEPNHGYYIKKPLSKNTEDDYWSSSASPIDRNDTFNYKSNSEWSLREYNYAHVRAVRNTTYKEEK